MGTFIKMKKKKSQYKPIIITILICLIWILFNESGLVKWVQLSYEHNQLTNELEKIQLEQKELTTHLDKLENDIDYIEGDIRNYDVVNRACKDIDTIHHLGRHNYVLWTHKSYTL
mgnify:CR=1 FL=1